MMFAFLYTPSIALVHLSDPWQEVTALIAEIPLKPSGGEFLVYVPEDCL